MSIAYTEKTEVQDLGKLIEKWASCKGSEPALIHEDRSMTFSELDKSVNRVANGLKKLGITQGDRVAIMLPNIPEFVFSFYGCQKLGAIAVPFNTMYKGKEISHILKDCGAKAVVCLTNFVSLINEIRSDLPELQHIITTGERTLTFADPESTLFIQAVLSKSLFIDLDDAYHAIGETISEALVSAGVKGVWYRHRGSLRIGGKKVAGFLISEAEDIYVINMICFISQFTPTDFFAALWVPPEVKDKIMEPLTSIEEELGEKLSDETLRNAVVQSLQKRFSVTLEEGAMTREEKFGYQKQRSLVFKGTGKDTPEKNSFFKRIGEMFKK